MSSTNKEGRVVVTVGVLAVAALGLVVLLLVGSQISSEANYLIAVQRWNQTLEDTQSLCESQCQTILSSAHNRVLGGSTRDNNVREFSGSDSRASCVRSCNSTANSVQRWDLCGVAQYWDHAPQMQLLVNHLEELVYENRTGIKELTEELAERVQEMLRIHQEGPYAPKELGRVVEDEPFEKDQKKQENIKIALEDFKKLVSQLKELVATVENKSREFTQIRQLYELAFKYHKDLMHIEAELDSPDLSMEKRKEDEKDVRSLESVIAEVEKSLVNITKHASVEDSFNRWQWDTRGAIETRNVMDAVPLVSESNKNWRDTIEEVFKETRDDGPGHTFLDHVLEEIMEMSSSELTALTGYTDASHFKGDISWSERTSEDGTGYCNLRCIYGVVRVKDTSKGDTFMKKIVEELVKALEDFIDKYKALNKLGGEKVLDFWPQLVNEDKALKYGIYNANTEMVRRLKAPSGVNIHEIDKAVIHKLEALKNVEEETKAGQDSSDTSISFLQDVLDQASKRLNEMLGIVTIAEYSGMRDSFLKDFNAEMEKERSHSDVYPDDVKNAEHNLQVAFDEIARAMPSLRTRSTQDLINPFPEGSLPIEIKKSDISDAAAAADNELLLRFKEEYKKAEKDLSLVKINHQRVQNYVLKWKAILRNRDLLEESKGQVTKEYDKLKDELAKGQKKEELMQDIRRFHVDMYKGDREQLENWKQLEVFYEDIVLKSLNDAYAKVGEDISIKKLKVNVKTTVDSLDDFEEKLREYQGSLDTNKAGKHIAQGNLENLIRQFGSTYKLMAEHVIDSLSNEEYITYLGKEAVTMAHIGMDLTKTASEASDEDTNLKSSSLILGIAEDGYNLIEQSQTIVVNLYNLEKATKMTIEIAKDYTESVNEYKARALEYYNEIRKSPKLIEHCPYRSDYEVSIQDDQFDREKATKIIASQQQELFASFVKFLQLVNSVDEVFHMFRVDSNPFLSWSHAMKESSTAAQSPKALIRRLVEALVDEKTSKIDGSLAMIGKRLYDVFKFWLNDEPPYALDQLKKRILVLKDIVSFIQSSNDVVELDKLIHQYEQSIWISANGEGIDYSPNEKETENQVEKTKMFKRHKRELLLLKCIRWRFTKEFDETQDILKAVMRLYTTLKNTHEELLGYTPFASPITSTAHKRFMKTFQKRSTLANKMCPRYATREAVKSAIYKSSMSFEDTPLWWRHCYEDMLGALLWCSALQFGTIAKVTGLPIEFTYLSTKVPFPPPVTAGSTDAELRKAKIDIYARSVLPPAPDTGRYVWYRSINLLVESIMVFRRQRYHRQLCEGACLLLISRVVRMDADKKFGFGASCHSACTQWSQFSGSEFLCGPPEKVPEYDERLQDDIVKKPTQMVDVINNIVLHVLEGKQTFYKEDQNKLYTLFLAQSLGVHTGGQGGTELDKFKSERQAYFSPEMFRATLFRGEECCRYTGLNYDHTCFATNFEDRTSWFPPPYPSIIQQQIALADPEKAIQALGFKPTMHFAPPRKMPPPGGPQRDLQMCKFARYSLCFALRSIGYYSLPFGVEYINDTSQIQPAHMAELIVRSEKNGYEVQYNYELFKRYEALEKYVMRGMYEDLQILLNSFKDIASAVVDLSKDSNYLTYKF
eukprot:Nk52_evm37s1485 gene=Nk52_evmTU37s1485